MNIKDLIKQAKELGAMTIIICGDGEPTIDPLLLPIIQFSSELGMNNILVSNGLLFGDETLCKDIHGFKATEMISLLKTHRTSLILKLESLNSETYEKIVGKSGAFHKFKQAIYNLRKMNFSDNARLPNGAILTSIAFSSVIGKLNIHEIFELRRFAHAFGAQFIAKFPSFVGNAVRNRDLFFNPYEETTRWLRVNFIRKFSDKPETLTADDIHCGVWHYGCVIGEEGELRLCYTSACSPELACLNVRNLPLKKILEERENLFKDMLERGESCHIKRKIYESRNQGVSVQIQPRI